MSKLYFFLRASDRVERVDSFFVHCVVVPSRGHRGLQNLLKLPPFGSSISCPDRVGG
jgi:hypothetical protein